ncbi:MAG: sigma-70 family RNA polymerase sigma factor [Calditrichaeota bacterium]|nr:sigma-70 family RNA polymerase sigma factor [Calditrichota bacterium]
MAEEVDYALLTDEELIARFQDNDIQSFNELVKRYKDPLYNFIFRFVNGHQIAEDVLQETFLRLYKNRDYYKEIAKFSTWIYTIAGNLAKTELRRRRRRQIFSIHNYMEDGKDFEIVDDERNPEEDVEGRNLVAEIQKAIDKLPETFKQAVVLRDIQGLDYEEISSILQTPLGTVKSRINRGRARLAKMLKPIL